MTKHRRISGFVAVALLAAATTAVTIKSYSSSADRPAASANAMSIGELTAGAGKLPTDEFDDQSVIYSKKR
ncbi:hypothetical protein FXV83_31345 [Bradyrhizobium hipponense]|uniref:DUF680 domain-containing protein n=1 Tax=Bradyrhizobium hipponense TaxID=2605638 RepID=A0A5S4YE82_9BRAD|nr:hypothetical protein [Bradyrhizobium hipponense]TYO62711.1 hypothetical protein FXV83_31345 [Bradyrhizobium hipponense]